MICPPPDAGRPESGGPEERQERIEWALTYPYERRPGSYVFNGVDDPPLDKYLSDRKVSFSELISGRQAVLACGSNAASDQLKRKSLPGDVPVIKAKLSGFDVVYSAHITRYGSIPATLQRSEGTVAEVFVTFLNDDQLKKMDISEGRGVNYDFIRLWDIRIEMERGGISGEIFSYHSRRGCLDAGGGCVSLAEVPAAGRRFPAMTQKQIQQRVMDLLGARTSVSEFILENTGGAGIRQARNQRLKNSAASLEWENFEILV